MNRASFLFVFPAQELIRNPKSRTVQITARPRSPPAYLLQASVSNACSTHFSHYQIKIPAFDARIDTNSSGSTQFALAAQHQPL